MELKDFISQSLVQIFEGVNQAQSKTKDYGGSIAPIVKRPHETNANVIGSTHSMAIFSVDFDVSVSITETADLKSGFGIFIAAFTGGVQTGEKNQNTSINRLRFSIPVSYPAQDGKEV